MAANVPVPGQAPASVVPPPPRAPVPAPAPAPSPPDYSLLGRFYPYAVPGAVQGSEEYKMKEAEDYLAYPPEEMQSYHLYKHRSSPLQDKLVRRNKSNISPSGIYLIYHAGEDEKSLDGFHYYVKNLTTNAEDRILNIPPEDHTNKSLSIHWKSTGDIFYIVRKGNEFRLDFYDACKNVKIKPNCEKNIDPEVGKEIAKIIDVSIPWKEILVPNKDMSLRRLIILSNVFKPEYLVTVVGKYLITLRIACGEGETVAKLYFTYKLNIGNLQTRLFVNSDQTIDVFVEGGKKVKCPILVHYPENINEVDPLEILEEEKQPSAGDTLFSEFRDAIPMYDSNVPIEINKSYHMVKDEDHYLVNRVTRPEGENVLKIRRFRATVGSLTLEGEYIVPCPSTPNETQNLRFDMKGNMAAVGDNKALIVYLLKDKLVQKIAEYAYEVLAVRVLPNGLVGCVLVCPLFDDDKYTTRITYLIVATGYPDVSERKDICTFRNYLNRGTDIDLSFCRVACRRRDKVFISLIPNTQDIYFQRTDQMCVNKERLREFDMTLEEIKGPFKLFVDDDDNFFIANIKDIDNGTKYILEWRKYSPNEAVKWKIMSLDISEYFKEEMENKIKVDVKTYCWTSSVIMVWPKDEYLNNICYLILEENKDSLVIKKESIYLNWSTPWNEMSIVNGHFWMVAFLGTRHHGIEDVSVLCVNLNKPEARLFDNPLKVRLDLVEEFDRVPLLEGLRGTISDDGETLFLQHGRTDKSLIYSMASKQTKVVMHYRHSCIRYKIRNSELNSIKDDYNFLALSTMSSDGKYLCISPMLQTDDRPVTIINLRTQAITTLDIINDILKDIIKGNKVQGFDMAYDKCRYAVIDIKSVYFCPVLSRKLDTACYYVLTIARLKDEENENEKDHFKLADSHRLPDLPCRGILCVMDVSMSHILMVAPGDVNPNTCVNYYIDHINQSIEWLDNDLLYHSLSAMIPSAYLILPVRHFIERYKLIIYQVQKDDALMRTTIDCIVDSVRRIEAKNNLHLYRHVIYTLYLVNDEQLFSQLLLKYLSYEDLFTDFNLFDIITKQPCTNSIRALMKKMQKDDKRFEYIKSKVDFFKGIFTSIEENYKSIISSDVCKEFITYLLFKHIGHINDVQLKDEHRTATSVLEGDKVLQVAEDKLTRRNPEIRRSYSVYETGFRLNLSIGSFFSYRFFKIIYSMNPYILQNKYRGIVYYKWDRYFKTVLAYSIIYWLNFILAYTYFGYYPKSAVLLSGVLLFTLPLLAFELRCIFSMQKRNRDEEFGMFINLKDYFMKISNYYDLFSLSFTLGVALLVNSYDLYTLINTPSLVWMRMWVVVLLGGRAITWLRVFARTRYLITSVMSVFVQMIPFLTILSCFILIFALMWRMADGLTGDYPPDGQLTFYESLVITLNLVFGNSTDTVNAPITEYTVVKFMIWILGNVTIPLTLLNFLIAVLSGVFEATTVERSLHDLYELIVIMEDFDQFFAGENEGVDIKLKDCTKLAIVFKNEGTEDESNYREWTRNSIQELKDMLIEMKKDRDGDKKGEIKH